MKKNFLIACLIVSTVSAQQIEIAVQKGHSADISAIVFNADGTLLASAGSDHLIKLWHIPTGREMASFSGTVLSEVVGLEFIGADDFLNVTYADGSLEKWNVLTSSLSEISTTSPLSAKSYVSYDQSYIIETEKFYLKKRELPSKRTIFTRVPVDISKRFNAIAVSETHKIILAANEDASIYAYHLDHGKSMGILEGHYASVNAVCFSANHALFASAGSDRSIIIWNTGTLQPLKRLFGKSFRYETLKFNHSGTKLAVGDELGFGRLIELQSSRIRVAVAKWHDQKVSAIRFSADDSVLYSGGFDNRLSVFNVQSEKVISKTVYKHYLSVGDFVLKKLRAYREPYAWISALDISPGGNTLAMGGAWKEAAIRESVQPLVLKSLNSTVSKMVTAHPGGISDVVFINDRTILTAGSDQLVRWHRDTLTNVIYYRKIKFPGMRSIARILPGPDQTILIQDENFLLYCDLEKELVLDSLYVNKPITGMTLNPVNGQLVYAMGNSLVFTNLSTWHDRNVTIPSAHSDKITSVDFNAKHPIIATCSWDATVKLWDAEAMKLLATIISIGSEDHIIITPDNYYYGTKNSLQAIGMKYGKRFVSPEQYDLRFNRPDIILDRLGFVPKQIVRSFNRAYLKRLQKMNFTEEMLSSEIHMPTLAFEQQTVPLNTTSENLAIAITASDSKYLLDRVNVFVNNIPVYGLNGISLRKENLRETSQEVELKLSAGRNKIQFSCMNEKGVESLLQTTEVTYNPPRIMRPNLYLAVISVSRYARPVMNLKYARKDGEDVVDQFKRSGWYENVFIDTLYDERATVENIHLLRNFFSGAGVNDQVICFVSGHGLLDENLDFYLATHDIDFTDPGPRGLRYEELEGLLDGIQARKKLLLIDACHSGEVDKSRIQSVQLTEDTRKDKKGMVATYTYPSDAEEENYRIGITTSFELMQEVFANVSRGSGAIVISAAAGNSYALESDDWKNGVFTFSLLNGMKNKLADKNRNGAITVTELKSFVAQEVEELTQGAQRPTSRSENLEFDFRVW